MHNYGYLCFDYVIAIAVTIVLLKDRANYLKIREVVAGAGAFWNVWNGWNCMNQTDLLNISEWLEGLEGSNQKHPKLAPFNFQKSCFDQCFNLQLKFTNQMERHYKKIVILLTLLLSEITVIDSRRTFIKKWIIFWLKFLYLQFLKYFSMILDFFLCSLLKLQNSIRGNLSIRIQKQIRVFNVQN